MIREMIERQSRVFENQFHRFLHSLIERTYRRQLSGDDSHHAAEKLLRAGQRQSAFICRFQQTIEASELVAIQFERLPQAAERRIQAMKRPDLKNDELHAS